MVQDLRFLRQTQFGVYDEDDCEGVHPDMIQQYYGTTKTRIHRHANQTGAGHPPEEYDNDLVGEVIEDQDPNIRHDAIPTVSSPAIFNFSFSSLYDLFAPLTHTLFLFLSLSFFFSQDQTGNKNLIGGTKKGTRRLLLVVVSIEVHHIIATFSHQVQVVVEAEPWKAILSH